VNMRKKDNKVVDRCPLWGHGTLCTYAECREAALSSFEVCKKNVPKVRNEGIFANFLTDECEKSEVTFSWFDERLT